MPIRPFLNGRQFDPETLRILGLAFEQVCIALQVETSDDDVKQAIANKVIEFDKAGGDVTLSWRLAMTFLERRYANDE